MAKNVSAGIPLIGPILNKIIGTRNERFVKKYTSRVEQINALDDQTRKLTDQQIKDKLGEFRARIDKGEKIDSILVEAFAIAREGMDRSVGIRNIFNPKYEAMFDPSKLPPAAREDYERIKGEVAAKPAVPPTGEFLGCADPVHGYMQVDLTAELCDAVRQIYTQSKPPFRARPFDVQLIGGMVLSGGKIAEMKTGEGKTIVGPLACYLAAIEGFKVHVVTVNDYLVQRDRDWTFPFFHALGLTVGAIHPMHMQPEQVKRQMYKCDVVYGTTAEFGFDYLRDNMKRSEEQQVQKKREFAIVDEVDSILIDEARTPLIISGPAHEDAPRYELADRLAKHLVEKQKPYQQHDDEVRACQRLIKGLEGDIRNARDKDKIPAIQARLKDAKAQLPALERERDKHVQYFEVEMDKKQANLTHDGIAEAQRVASLGSFYVGENMDLPHQLTQAVRAHVVYQRDRDYIVAPSENPMTGRMEPSVVIVDVNTGRPMVGRQWSDGLHQAVEAKEQVPIKQETQTVATITIQNFFKMYKRLAGMTGTADTEAQEFHDIYKLDVVSIPTNLAVVRRDYDDLMFLTGKDKWEFIVDEIKHFHDVGRPVLVGTTSVEKSETLSKMLTNKHGVKHEVLNAKQHEKESLIVENAGQLGAVMIATNMAGRGTDIKLGRCTREGLLDHWLRRGIVSRGLTTQSTVEELRENVYRKVGPGELELPKREVETMPVAELELRLLKHWVYKHTLDADKKVDSMTADELRERLDRSGRFLLHRIQWFDSVEDLGGLHVIGTERHESRRIDNQLRGRSGRQGDKGSSRFFVGLDDELMKLFAGERTMRMLSIVGMKEGDAIEHPMLSKSVERAQRKVEERNFQIRKNILEYDEVMEHQRQRFYGLRQRVLEGRDVRGLIFDYIRDAAKDAVGEFLDKNYAARCASDHVKGKLDVTIEWGRLKGMEPDEMDQRIRQDAKDEIRQMISVTLGEYIPEEGSEVAMDFDAEGLARWARSHFGVEFSPDDLRARGQNGRREISDALIEAAEKRVDETDLSDMAVYSEKDYGAKELARWAERKFGMKLDVGAIAKAQSEGAGKVEELIVKQAAEQYTARELEFPVEFAMETAIAQMRQSPQAAAQGLCDWANLRFDLGWTPDTLMKTPPAQCKEQLKAASRAFIESGRMGQLIAEAKAITSQDELDAWFKTKLRAEAPQGIRRMSDQEREDAVRAKIEMAVRPEMIYLERTILLETLDDLWKNHLYGMDQLRDGIGFRAFSQQDPRIAYKSEGSKAFTAMMEDVRERVTDFIFKAQLRAPAPPPVAPPPRAQPAPLAAAGGGGGGGGYYTPPSGGGAVAGAVGLGAISGPGLDAAMSERQQRDLEAAQRAGVPADAKQAPVVKNEKRYGRNDPCPQGCGRKYKKCCNRPDGTCNGAGLTQPAPAGGDDD
jgi:preprotein translocase subunit SecA